MAQSFKGVLEADGKGLRMRIPFDPDEVWGAKDRHHVTGSVAGCTVRGELKRKDGAPLLLLGPAWVRDNPLAAGDEVEVKLSPEGPKLADDVAAALSASPEAKRFFESLPTFYRNNFIRWIESAKRPETRAKRIAETVELCASGKRER
jgi:hypothetical protein